MTTFSELRRLSRQDLSGKPPVRVALVGDSATQLLAVALRGEAARNGVNIELYEAEYDQVEPELLVQTSELHRFGASYVVLFQSTAHLLDAYDRMPHDERNKLAEWRLSQVEQFLQSTPATLIVMNYPERDDAVYGSHASKVDYSFIYQLRLLNLGLMDMARHNDRLQIVDLCLIQAEIGRSHMLDTAVSVSTDMQLSIDILPVVARRTLEIVWAMQGRFHKCLIMDLDNTLWGGEVGELGWQGIDLGRGLGIGKVFVGIQHWARKLRQQGVILAVVSKNDDNRAREPFLHHPDMVLRMDDIAVFVANWNSKAENIRLVQRILNIGYDAMVFLDDSPFERNLVRQQLPEVCVPELPEDPAEYMNTLSSLNLFETTAVSNADTARTRQYQQEAKRMESSLTFSNETEYLRSLQMTCQVDSLTDYNCPRVAQLTQRSNQFNLRTVRYTETQLRELDQDADAFIRTFTLADRFGASGLIGVLIAKRQPDGLFIDSWLMSCRVLKRGVEHFMLNVLVELARECGCNSIVGEYLPSPKNGMVSSLYPSLGFKQTGVEGRYRLDVQTFEPITCYINRQ